MFSQAKCGHCGKVGTKIEQIEPRGAAYKQSAIACKWCNSILGVTGYYDAGQLIKEQQKEIVSLKSSVDAMSYQLNQIANFLNHR